MSKRFPLCVIPAAGEGTRMGGACKALQVIDGKSVILRVVEFWSDYAEEIVIVINPKHRDQWKAQDQPPMPLVRYVEQLSPRGICDAVVVALRAHRCPDSFIVALGDCLFDGEFDFPDRPFTGFGVMEPEDSDLARSYAVGKREVIEKPLLGLGAYFLTWNDIVALEDEAHMATQGVRCFGLTEAIRSFGTGAKRVPFKGRYLNVTYPEDLLRW